MDRPTPKIDNLVEAAYLERILSMTGTQRVQRTVSLYHSMVRMIRHRIEREHPGLSERDIRIKIAETLYQSDPMTLELIKRAKDS